MIDNKVMRIGIVTPYRTVDGIAEYSRRLYAPLLADQTGVEIYFLASRDFSQINSWKSNDVHRCWDRGANSPAEIVAKARELRLNIVHIQLHESFMQLGATAQLLHQLHQAKIQIFLTPHLVKAPAYDLAQIAASLNLCAKVYVHSEQDVSHLQRAGVQNAVYFPHPFPTAIKVNKQLARTELKLDTYYPIVATHGLIAPNKGLVEVLESIVHLRTRYPQILWLAVNALNKDNPRSVEIHGQLHELIRHYELSRNVMLVDDFLQNDEEIIALISTADVGVLAYSDWGESASGAARKFIAAQIPTVATNIKQLLELKNALYLIASNQPVDIVSAVNDLLAHANQGLVRSMLQQCQELSSKFSWEVMAGKLKHDYLQTS